MNRWVLHAARVACAVILLLALVGTWGWVTHTLPLIQPRPQYALMQYNTAVCLIFCALGMLGLLASEARAARAGAAPALIISVWVLAEYGLGVPLGIDTLLIHPFTSVHTLVPGRMGLNNALAIFLSAACLVFCSQKRLSPTQGVVIGVGASLVFALGTVPLLGYVSGIVEAYRSGSFTRMSLQASVCFMLLGPMLMFYAGQRSGTLPRMLPLAAFLALITVSTASAIAVRVHERQQIIQSLHQQADETARSIGSELDNLYGALNRIALRWEAMNGTPRALWASDVRSYRHDMAFIPGISWMNSQGVLQWIEPMVGNENLIGKPLALDPDRAPTIAAAIAARAPMVTPAIALLNHHGTGYLYVRPLYLRGRYDGMIITGIQLQPLLEKLGLRANPDFAYLLRQNGQDAIAVPSAGPALAAWEVSAKVPNLDQPYELVIRPSEAYIAERHSMVPAAVSGTGTLMAVLVALSIRLTLRANEQARRLAEAEQFTRTMLASASHLIVAADVEGRVLLLNPEAERSLGYAATDAIGQTPARWHDPDEIAERLEALRQRTGLAELSGMDVFTYDARRLGSYESEWTFVRRDGSRFPGSLTVTPRYSAQKVLLGYLGIIQDKTEQKQGETLLRLSEETFRLAMEHSPIGMALVSLEGRWMKVNQALCELLGYQREELLATDFQTLTHSDDLSGDLERVNSILAGTIKNYTLEKRYIHKRGHTVKILLSVSLVRNEDGSPKHFISMIQDISEREALIAQLGRTNAELEQFAYVASHDLQEPLRMVTSFVGLIGEQYADTLDSEGKEYIGIAVDAAKRMQVLIADILVYAQSGRESQAPTDIDCNAEMRHVLQNLATLIDSTQADVRVGPLPSVRGNPVEFLRLMQNLIGNAIKFHRPGLTPYVQVDSKRIGHNWYFSVIDNGIGIKQEYIDRIFQPFKRLHTQQEYSGSGIGLAVCRKIVENFGGRIWVESEPGTGSTVRFTIPVPTKESHA